MRRLLAHSSRLVAAFCPLALTFLVTNPLSAEPLPPEQLEAKYTSEVRPIVSRYCDNCHGATETVEADLNLSALNGWGEASRQVETWQLVKEMVRDELMPPEDAEQPTLDERAKLQRWLDDYLAAQASVTAGDPGPVVIRRLSNAEYTYTLRDLTGVSSLDPAREFPADGAAGEGFTNTGNALVMSPALVTKYLDAAKEVARHAVLLPDGIRFSTHTTPSDWTNDILAEIRAFYAQFTEAGGEHLVTQQGVPLDVGLGGRIPLTKYFAATIEEREVLTNKSKSFAEVARGRPLSAKYLATLWTALNDDQPSVLMDSLRTKWRAAKPGDQAKLAADVEAVQKGLFTFASVGLIGRKGGPKQWLEPVSPLVSQQELRLKLPESTGGADVIVSLVASDAGDGNTHDFVVWKQPRLVAPGRPDLSLRDASARHDIGIEEQAFGKHPAGGELDADSLCVHAPASLVFRLPASLAAGCELVTTAALDEHAGAEGSVQVRAEIGKVEAASGLQLGAANITEANGTWSDDNRRIASESPILVVQESEARKRVEAQLEEFRQLFPAALCYTKIVPVDEVVTLVLFHREDEHLQRLMLDDEQTAHLNRLWDELHYVSQDALKQVDVLEQLLEYASQDADPTVFLPLKEPTAARAAAFRELLLKSEPRHLDAAVDFAARAYRRPLTEAESTGLRELYHSLRKDEIPHDEAIRLVIARVLVSPDFLYRAERPVEGAEHGPASDWELANRLSYFLWSSQPDDELRELAAAGKLHDPDVLVQQTHRMLRDAKVRRLAIEFACQWLQIHDFDQLDEKSDRHFPTFAGLRGAMYEESILFFTYLFADNRPVLDILTADYTYLNEPLAQHYGIAGVTGPEWQLVDGLKKYSRGGVLAQATILTKQSGASRTSPILRGTWVSEVILGERLPKPPKGVPPLPDDDASNDELTMRQLVEKHVSDAKCAVCHVRIDPYGFALEHFDAIGRYREEESGGQPIDARSQLSDGTPIDGFAGLQNYLANERRDAFVRQFCRKLLGYALGRSVQLSDEPLLAEMQSQLAENEFRVSTAVETIVRSPQFRNIRGRDALAKD